MTTSMPRSVVRQIEKFRRRHAEGLGPDEQILSACQVQAITTPIPPKAAAWFGLLGVVIGHRLGKANVPARIESTEAALGLPPGAFTSLPRTKDGYSLVLTDKRVLVYDRRLKSFMSESPIAGVALRTVPHPGGLKALVFDDGAERVAMVAESGNEHHFVESYHEIVGLRRLQAEAQNSDAA